MRIQTITQHFMFDTYQKCQKNNILHWVWWTNWSISAHYSSANVLFQLKTDQKPKNFRHIKNALKSPFAIMEYVVVSTYGLANTTTITAFENKWYEIWIKRKRERERIQTVKCLHWINCMSCCVLLRLAPKNKSSTNNKNTTKSSTQSDNFLKWTV